jgi:tetratricopeptide (TPR) repeat protein
VPKKKGNPLVMFGAIGLVLLLVVAGAFFVMRPSGQSGSSGNSVELQQANQSFNRNGGLDDALVAYRGVLAKDPENLEAQTRIALIHLLRGNYPEAEQAARTAANGTKEAAWAQAVLAEALNGLYRFDEAARAAETAISLDPQHSAGYAARAMIRADQGERESNVGRLQEALADAEKAVSLAGNDELLKALAERARGNVLWSQYIVVDDIKLLEEANKAMEAAAGEQAQLAILQANLGGLQNFFGYHAQDTDQEDQANEYFDQAIQFFERAQELDPKLSGGFAGMGWTHVAREEYDDAITAFDQAISVSNRNVSAYIGKSRALRDQATPDYPAAIEVLEAGINIVQQDPQLYSTLGWLYLTQGFDATANTDKIKHFNDAETQFRIALERNPRDVEALNGRGWALRALGDVLKNPNLYNDALAILNESLSLRPRQFDASFGRGWVYYAQEKYAQAEAEFRSALDARPADSGGYYWLGLALIEQGRTNDARAALERAVELGSPYAQDELDNLR